MSEQTSFEALVIQRLDELRDDNKLFLDKLDEHAKDDVARFEAIDQQFTTAATLAAEAKGVAKTTAKVWGIVSGAGTTLIAALFALWKAFHGLK